MGIFAHAIRFEMRSTIVMDTVLQDLDCAFVYLDDILVASSSAQSHIDDLNAVFHRLRHHGLVIKLEKCLFGVSSLDFFGASSCRGGLSAHAFSG